jgi:hypothetical protein
VTTQHRQPGADPSAPGRRPYGAAGTKGPYDLGADLPLPGQGRTIEPGNPGEGGASWYWFEGNFASYLQNKIGRLGEEASRPHRVTYRRLTR